MQEENENIIADREPASGEALAGGAGGEGDVLKALHGLEALEDAFDGNGPTSYGNDLEAVVVV